MKLSKHAELLQVAAEMGTYYPVILHDEENVVLVDTGFPFNAEPLIKAIEDSGFQPRDINRIILTHQDIDHIGGVKDILALAPKAKVLAYEEEAPYIDGRMTPIKLANMDKSNPFYETFQAGFAHSIVPVQQELIDRWVLPICGGIEVIHTSGHTPGHICLYIQEDKVLIAGDALNIADGKLVGPNPQVTYDMALAMESVEKLKGYDVDIVAVYHGGRYDGGVEGIF